jgi:hypothetical protein
MAEAHEKTLLVRALRNVCGAGTKVLLRLSRISSLHRWSGLRRAVLRLRQPPEGTATVPVCMPTNNQSHLEQSAMYCVCWLAQAVYFGGVNASDT